MPDAKAKFAVAITVLRHDEGEGWQVLMVARKDDHSRWSLPGGKLEPGETPPEAAKRELREETGIMCVVDDLVPQETVLDSGGYLTTFYLLSYAYREMPISFASPEGEAPVRWGRVEDLLDGPFGIENRERFTKMGIIR